MKNSFLRNNFHYIIIFLFNVLMIFINSFSNYLQLGISLVFIIWSLIYWKEDNFFWKLLYTLFSLLPVSFASIINSSFTISWFQVILLILFIVTFFTSLIDKRYLIIIIIFFIYGLLSSIFQPSFRDAIKQVIMIVLCLFSFIIGNSAKDSGDKNKFQKAEKILFVTILAMAVQIIIQFICYRFFKRSFGYIQLYNKRIAYGGLMNDFSFASLCLALGVFIGIVMFENKEIRLINFLLLEIVIIIATLITSARTGIFALIITLGFYIFYTTIKKKRKIISGIILIGFSLSIVLLSNYILSDSRSSQNILDDSGRIGNYLKALQIFSNNPFFGIGFGLYNLRSKVGISVPHNFFIQYLCQSGLVGCSLICIPFIIFLKEEAKSSGNIIWLFYLIFIGAMFIPDITSSRFLSLVIILVFIASGENNKRIKRDG